MFKICMIGFQKMEKHRKIADPGRWLWALYSLSLKFIANNSELYWNYQIPWNKHRYDWLSLTPETDFLHHQNSARGVRHGLTLVMSYSWPAGQYSVSAMKIWDISHSSTLMFCKCLDRWVRLFLPLMVKFSGKNFHRFSHGSQEERDSCLHSYTPTLHLPEKVVLSELVFGAAHLV